ncbi:hypothetical protein [Rhodoferax koreensis]|uniref:hypothetical protein n=1 Tax=Rhodoferax koreensis TaxID=1842727 RepID=UPI0012FFC352|nr:hypothetical protein [Rhodoferax koreense]
MKHLNEREQIRNAATKWRWQYAGYPKNSEFSKISQKLEKLDVNSATAEDVKNIIGNDSWCSPMGCNECGKSSWECVELGEPADYESRTAHICRDCLVAALALIGVNT